MSKGPEKDTVWYEDEDPLDAKKKETDKVVERDIRRQKVFDLYFNRNNTQQQVAQVLGVHVQTIKNDIKAIRQDSARGEITLSMNERIGESLARRKVVVSETWYQYNTIKDPQRAIEKLKYLDMFRKACVDLDTFKMDVGLIPKAADRKEISITTDMAREMSLDELLNKQKTLVEEILGEQSVEEIITGKFKVSNDKNGS